MRNFSKTLISMAAVMAVGSAMAAGAMAAMTASYADGTVTLTDNTVAGTTSKTVLVVAGEEKTGENDEKYYEYIASDTTIRQIDQDDATGSTPYETVYVGELDAGSYEVRVGCDTGAMASAVFTVGGKNPGVDYTIGDVNPRKGLDSGDMSMILNKIKNPNGTYQKAGLTRIVNTTKTYACGRTLTEGTQVTLGDVNPRKGLDSGDISMILNKIKNPSGTYQLAGEILNATE